MITKHPLDATSKTNLYMQYLGTVQVLCDTHNQLMKTLQLNTGRYDAVGDTDVTEQVETMEAIANDFNASCLTMEVIRHGNIFDIFDKEVE